MIAQCDHVHMKADVLELHCVSHRNAAVQKASEGAQAAGSPGTALTEGMSSHDHVPTAFFFPMRG